MRAMIELQPDDDSTTADDLLRLVEAAGSPAPVLVAAAVALLDGLM